MAWQCRHAVLIKLTMRAMCHRPGRVYFKEKKNASLRTKFHYVGFNAQRES